MLDRNEFYKNKERISKKTRTKSNQYVSVVFVGDGQTIGQQDVERDKRKRHPTGKLTQSEDKVTEIL